MRWGCERQPDATLVAPPARNFVCLLEETARRHPDKTALVCEDATLTYGRLHARAAGLARRLAADGVGPGHRVAVVLPDHWSYAVALLGIWKLGATAAPLSPLLKPDEQEAILADVDPAAILRQVEAREGVWETVHAETGTRLVIHPEFGTGRPANLCPNSLCTGTPLYLATTS